MLQIPAGIDPGVHNLQVVGYDPDGNVLVFTVGVVVPGAGGGTDGFGGDSLLAATGIDSITGFGTASLVLFALGTVAVVVSRRRTAVNR
jgi:hypothetical protein